MTLCPAVIPGFESKTATVAEVRLHYWIVWQGMVHVFPANLALLQAAREALDTAGDFLRRNLDRHLTTSRSHPFNGETL